ncbi:hypothetical protein [Ferrovibrio sp.]|uniref:hypothetical protein n=1 Tax=Ferrovibrio sp. TaxID=1917215 RepID=UPI003D148C26
MGLWLCSRSSNGRAARRAQPSVAEQMEALLAAARLVEGNFHVIGKARRPLPRPFAIPMVIDGELLR